VLGTNDRDRDGTVEENNDVSWDLERVLGVVVVGVSVDGGAVGVRDDGDAVGANVGETVVGAAVVGGSDGDRVGVGVVGIPVGTFVGDSVGGGLSFTSTTNEPTPLLTVLFSHKKGAWASERLEGALVGVAVATVPLFCKTVHAVSEI